MPKDSPEMYKYKVRQTLKRKLWCAFFAEDAFNKTIASVENYMSMGIKVGNPLHFTFVSSVAITYSRFFIGADTMIVLPPAFFKFPTVKLERTHKWLIDSRNTIYAHTDATAALYELSIVVKYVNGKHEIGLEGKGPEMMGHSFPDVLALCSFQKARLREHMSKLLEELLPTEHLEFVLEMEKSNSTIIPVRWPKPLSPNITVPPNSW